MLDDDRTRFLRSVLRIRDGVVSRIITVIAAAAAAVLVGGFVAIGTPPAVHAADVFGPLRSPGEPAVVVGHRGDRANAPENTLPALERAMRSFPFVETDVRLTSDGVPVLFHDATLERVTGASGRVRDHTADELRTLDAGSWYSTVFRGEPIPTLAEFLDVLQEHDARALVELKAAWTSDDVGRLDDLLRQHRVSDQVVLQSFSIETLENLRRVIPDVPRIMLTRELPTDPIPLGERFDVIAFGTTARAVVAKPEALALFHEAGFGVLCYTLNTQERWEEVSALGVDGIITDQPSDLEAWLAAVTPQP